MQEKHHTLRLEGYEGLAASIIAQAIYDLETKEVNSEEYEDALEFIFSSWCEKLADFINWDYRLIKKTVIRLDEVRRANNGSKVAIKRLCSKEITARNCIQL